LLLSTLFLNCRGLRCWLRSCFRSILLLHKRFMRFILKFMDLIILFFYLSKLLFLLW
jgi:hypothetical protein